MFDKSSIMYDLPPDAVAKAYPARRSEVKLMVLKRSGEIVDAKFVEILDFLEDQECYANNAKYAGPKNEHIMEPVYARIGETYVIPTAGVPFEEWMIERINPKYVTLCTPKGLDFNSDKIYQTERTPREWYHFKELPGSYPVVALGTTSMKALETYARTLLPSGTSEIFIRPGFEFLMTKGLLTNFHYPGEAQLALTCAFGGVDNIMRAYRHALSRGYKFSDRGDRMLIL